MYPCDLSMGCDTLSSFPFITRSVAFLEYLFASSFSAVALLFRRATTLAGALAKEKNFHPIAVRSCQNYFLIQDPVLRGAAVAA